MKVTPSWVGTFETNLQTLIQDAWKRMTPHLVWDKFMDVKQSATLRELYFWLIESAKIVDEGLGGNKRFDDIAATFFEVDNTRSGLGLRLTKDEIEDNMMASPALRGMPALEYSANWARQMGGNAGYRPQDILFNNLIANGETAKGYDGQFFFSSSHPTNPALETGVSTTYSNLQTGVEIDATNASTLDAAVSNFAKAVANVRTIVMPNGKPRNLVVRYALAGPLLQKRLNEILDTKYFGTGQGSTENVVSRYGIEPVIASELTSATDYYLACEMLPGEGGPFIWQDRLPYALTSYAPETLAELQRRKEFEWSFDGRNAGAFGHPYLFHKCKH